MDSLAEWLDTHLLSLKQMTLRMVVLLALFSGQRGQSIHSLQVEDIKLHDNRCVIVYSSVVKQTKVGRHVKPLELASFENKRLCIVLHLKEYLRRTKDLRAGKELFISFVTPHRHVSRDTIFQDGSKKSPTWQV